MKNIYTILLGALLILSCGGNKETSVEDIIATNNLEDIRAKRAEVVTKQQEFTKQLKQLDEKLALLSPDKNVPLITSFLATKEKFNHFLELQGNVATKQNLVLTPEMSGILTKVLVKEGQNVSKGQLLATIDDGGMSQQRAQLTIQVDLAKTTFERQKRLWDQKIGSEMQYLQSKSNYESQLSALNQINKQLAKTRITAPFSGVIDDVITEAGNVVAPGQSPIVRIVNLSDMYIEVDVPERYLANVTKDAKVNVNFPVLNENITTKVRQTGSFINPANRTFKVEIGLPDSKLDIKPNLTAKLKINDYTNKSALLIPQSIISENASGEQYIYLLKDKKDDKATAKQVIITTGKTQGDVIEVLSGIKDNDEIILEGARSVKDGQKVKNIK